MDYDIELSEGKIVGLPYTDRHHSETMALLVSRIVPFVYSNRLGRVYCNADGFALQRKSNEQDSAARIHIAYLSAARAPDPDYGGLIEGAPDLAVEIASPNRSANAVELKLSQLRDAGAKIIWVVYPKSRSVTVRKGNHGKKY